MSDINKQILRALIYIKDNPDCSSRNTELSDKITHHLYENGYITGYDSHTSSSPKNVDFEYSYINITTDGEIYLEKHKTQLSLFNIFKNKTIIFIVSSVFATLLTIASAIFLFHYYQNHEKSSQNEIQPAFNATETIFPKIKILIDGSNNKIYFKVNTDNIPSKNRRLEGANVKETIRVPIGQRVTVNMAGSNNKIYIQKQLLNYIETRNNGSNNKTSTL